MRADVAIIIITYNSEEQIRECLSSVLEERQAVTQEIIVVDNQSKDSTVKIIQEEFPQVKLYLPESNLGFAKGVNYAAKQADAEFLLLLNPDTVVRKHAIDVVFNFAKSNPHYGLYGGRTLKDDLSLEPSSCWELPSLWSFLMFATGLSTAFRHNPLLDPESIGGWARDTVREVGVITGCFLLVSSEAWQKLDGFDERYWMYGEDADLAIRARKAGYRPVICPEAELVHEVGASSDTPAKKMMLLFKGKATLARTHWHGIKGWLGIQMLTAGVCLRAFMSRAKRTVSSSKSEDRWGEVWSRRREWQAGYQEVSND